MVKKKKSKFRLRYIMIITLLLLIYQLYKVLVPVNRLDYEIIGDVDERKVKSVKRLMSDFVIDSVDVLNEKLKKYDWIEEIRLGKNVMGVLKVNIYPREAFARIYGMEDKAIDREGNIFEYTESDSLRILYCSVDSSAKYLANIKELLHIVDEIIYVEEIDITPEGIITRGKKFTIMWGYNEFYNKYLKIKGLLRRKFNYHMIFDLRFESMIVLRR